MDSFLRLKHIEKAISTIEKYISDESESGFYENQILIDAVLFQFTIIGEAIIHVDDKLLHKYDYQWYKVRSFRNLIAHEYFNIKFPAVWAIIQKDLPVLKQLIHNIILNEFPLNPDPA